MFVDSTRILEIKYSERSFSSRSVIGNEINCFLLSAENWKHLLYFNIIQYSPYELFFYISSLQLSLNKLQDVILWVCTVSVVLTFPSQWIFFARLLFLLSFRFIVFYLGLAYWIWCLNVFFCPKFFIAFYFTMFHFPQRYLLLITRYLYDMLWLRFNNYAYSHHISVVPNIFVAIT